MTLFVFISTTLNALFTPVMSLSFNHLPISLSLQVVMTDYDLAVRWDGVSTAEVWLSEYYAGNVCGLCGNLDGDANNDFTKPDGSEVSMHVSPWLNIRD